MQDHKRGLEQITKHYNAVSSGIVKKRNRINALRKERTLYDHIFKTLEYQILDQEKRLYDLIEENQDKEVIVKDNQKNLVNIIELVNRNKYEDFYKIIDEEKKKYMEELATLKTNTNEENKMYGELEMQPPLHLLVRPVNINETRVDTLTDKVAEDGEYYEITNQIKFYEELFAELSLYTVSEDLGLIEEYMYKGDELNEQLYQNFVEIENQYEDLKQEYNSLKQQTTKQDSITVSTAITEQDQLSSANLPFEDLNKNLNSLLVK